MQLHQWEDLTSDGAVRALKYSFGPGTSNTLAARLDDGSWLVVSPCARAPEAALDALAKDGPVSALVAPNGFHHLGQPAWRARFPEAVSYAAEGSLPRLAAKASGVPFRPLGELAAKLPARVRLHEPAGMKKPDLLCEIGSGGGTVWFGGDLLSNTVAADLALPARLLFGLLGGGPGYRFSKVAAMMYLSDRVAWKKAVRDLLDTSPPLVVLPAHGDPVRDDAHAKTRAILA